MLSWIIACRLTPLNAFEKLFFLLILIDLEGNKPEIEVVNY
jgi:hypothetical protein